MLHLVIVALAAGAATGIGMAWALLPPALPSGLQAYGWAVLVCTSVAMAAAADHLRRRRLSPPSAPAPADPRQEDIRQLLAALDRLHRSRREPG